MRLSLVIMVLTLIAGCVVGGVHSTFTPYHTLPQNFKSKSVAVVAGNKALNESLEFEQYKQKLEAKFAQIGMAIAENKDKATYLAYFNFGIDSGATTTHTGSMPIYGNTGGGSSYHSGTVSSYDASGYSFGSYSGTSYTPPSYGITGNVPYSYDVTRYTRVLALEIFDQAEGKNRTPKKVYQAKLTSKGRCGQLGWVIDEMLTALFKEFPGESGRPMKVVVDPKSSQKC